MAKSREDIKKKIMTHLEKETGGLSASQIAKQISHNRITVTKYLEILKAQGFLSAQNIAQATIWRKQETKPKILIVDDEPHIINLVKWSLPTGKYTILEAYSGMQALQKLHEQPELVILDLMMPGIDGFTVCQTIKASPETAHIPVILLSAKQQLKDKVRGMDCGADEYLTKPFDPLELEGMIKNLLNNIELPNRKELLATIDSMSDDKKQPYILRISLPGLLASLGKRNLLFRCIEHEVEGKGIVSVISSTEFIVIARENVHRQVTSVLERSIPYLLGRDEICPIPRQETASALRQQLSRP
ncbi:response regulator [Candidatus Woesearchaeota archaeon]|nr:response regulator [Candidatus Woesearchaeota archaeon]